MALGWLGLFIAFRHARPSRQAMLQNATNCYTVWARTRMPAGTSCPNSGRGNGLWRCYKMLQIRGGVGAVGEQGLPLGPLEGDGGWVEGVFGVVVDAFDDVYERGR